MPFRRGFVASRHLIRALAGNNYEENNKGWPRGGKNRAVEKESFIMEAGDRGGVRGRKEREGLLGPYKQ
jgi:hypothetical protein